MTTDTRTSTFNATSHIYADPGIDPGAAPIIGSQAASAIGVRTAVAHGELPTLPNRLRNALAADAAVQGLRNAVFGATLEGKRGMAALTRKITDAALAGETLPTAEEFRTQALNAWLEDQAGQAQSTALNALHRTVKDSAPVAITAALPEALTAVRTEVEAALTEARALIRTLDGLDIHHAAAVAEATKAQRDAVTSLPAVARRYNRLRMLQRDLMVASHLDPAGTTGLSVDQGVNAWRGVFETGLYEFSHITPGDPGPELDMPSVDRLIAVAARDDVWVPSIEQAEDAWQDRLNSGSL